ncbi:hypothetical protein [Neptuniibacter sp. QD37_11]|uniref:ADP-ribosyltransferase-containing protein n=1 Tax=Neptuniibacter sp. QD37_11 TaxID=3398209 RepID=UPI0039F547BF
MSDIYYHGTQRFFKEFKLGQAGVNSTFLGSEPVRRGVIFVAEDYDLAREFADQGGSKGHVLAVKANISATLDISEYGFGCLPESFFEDHGLNPRYYYQLNPWDAWQAFDLEEGESECLIVEALKAEGYDSVKLMDVSEFDVENTTSIAVFDPKALCIIDRNLENRPRTMSFDDVGPTP